MLVNMVTKVDYLQYVITYVITGIPKQLFPLQHLLPECYAVKTHTLHVLKISLRTKSTIEADVI